MYPVFVYIFIYLFVFSQLSTTNEWSISFHNQWCVHASPKLFNNYGQEILISFSILDSIPPDRLYNIRGTNGRLAGKSLVSRFHKRETNTNSQKYRRYNIYITHILLFIHHLKKIHAHIDKAYDKC